MITPQDAVQILQTYGAWGMVVILLFALWGLWRYSCKTLEKRHTEFMTVLQETTKALAATAVSTEKMTKTQEKSNEIMEKTQESNAAAMSLINFCQKKKS